MDRVCSRYRRQWEIAKAPSGGSSHPTRIAAGGDALSQIEWSPKGAIWFLVGQELFRVADSGGDPALVAKGVATFMLQKAGESVYLIRQDRTRTWQLTTLSVVSGAETASVPLALDVDASIAEGRLHPDGTHFVLSVTRWKRDIWILAGWKPRSLFDLWLHSTPGRSRADQAW